MNRKRKSFQLIRMVLGSLLVATSLSLIVTAQQPAPEPSMLDPRLEVRKFVSGLTTPTAIAFIGEDDVLILEKNTGLVRRVVRGVLQPNPVLQLPVNFFSERGLLGIALHPDSKKITLYICTGPRAVRGRLAVMPPMCRCLATE